NSPCLGVMVLQCHPRSLSLPKKPRLAKHDKSLTLGVPRGRSEGEGSVGSTYRLTKHAGLFTVRAVNILSLIALVMLLGTRQLSAEEAAKPAELKLAAAFQLPQLPQ